MAPRTGVGAPERACQSGGTDAMNEKRRLLFAVGRWMGNDRSTGIRARRTPFRVLRHSSRRVNGATLVEFVVAVPFLLMLVLAVLQSALFFMARSQLGFAVEYAAQYAALRHGTIDSLKQGLALGLVSLQPGSALPGVLDLGNRIRAARTLIADPRGLVRVERISPVDSCFADWGDPIPNSHLRFRARGAGVTSGLSIQDCNVLKVRVVYGYRPPLPIVRHLLFATLMRLDPGENLYRVERLPIEAMAVRHMQSDTKR